MNFIAGFVMYQVQSYGGVIAGYLYFIATHHQYPVRNKFVGVLFGL